MFIMQVMHAGLIVEKIFMNKILQNDSLSIQIGQLYA